MDLTWALIIYIVVVVLLFIILRAACFVCWDAIVLSLLVGYFVLLALRSPATVHSFICDTQSIIYAIILLGTPIVFAYYIVENSLRNCRFEEYCKYGNTYTNFMNPTPQQSAIYTY